jgi:hypothetical protein
MTSYPSTPEPDRLTTQQLVSSAKRDTGHEPTARQLYYWVDAGLLGKPEQKSLGQGRGSMTLWDAETLPRVVTILQARTGEKRRNIALDSARLLLVLKGYVPADTRLLRDTFSDYLTAWAEQVADQQNAARELLDMLQHPPSRRLARELEAMPDAGGRLMQSMLAFMLPDAAASNPLQRLSYYFSPAGLREALDATEYQQLRAAYSYAGYVGALLDSGQVGTQVFDPLMLPGMQATLDLVLPARLLERMPSGVQLSRSDMRRIPLTLALIAWHHYDSHLTEAWEATGRQIAPVAHNVAERLRKADV